MDSKKFIKKLKKARVGVVAEGTVVKWKSSIYTYAAVYAGGKWWITGTGRWYGGNMFDSDAFITIIKSASEVSVATEWESVD